MPNGWDNFSQPAILSALLVSLAVSGNAQQAKTAPGDWPSYNHDMASTRYSLLTQINAKNVGTLKSAWTYSLKGKARRLDSAVEDRRALRSSSTASCT